VKYKGRANQVVEMPWREVDLNAVIEGQPWRRFPWYLGQRNYSGSYWSATERTTVGYESRLELAHLIIADLDPNVKHIASQPFHLAFRSDGRTVHRTPDYLLMTDAGPRIVDVKPSEKLLNEKIKQLLELTRDVVKSAGFDYEVASEPDDVFLANVRFLAGYRRDGLFDSKLLDEIRGAAASEPESFIAEIIAEVDQPKQAVFRKWCRLPSGRRVVHYQRE
jgi:TnsA endonuclease N terminal